VTELAGPPRVEVVYLKPEVVAARLDVSVKTLYRWARAGKIPATTLPGGTLRFDPRRLEVWLGQRTRGSRHHIHLAPKPAPPHEAAGA
jgi:excisionase family DNA binding protein